MSSDSATTAAFLAMPGVVYADTLQRSSMFHPQMLVVSK